MRARVWLLCMVLALAVGGPSGIGRAGVLPELDLKVAYLYNFVVYTQWPDANAPSRRVCFFGPDNLADAAQTLETRTVGASRLNVVSVNSPVQGRQCHVLFVSEREAGNMESVYRALGDSPVLVVADTPSQPRAMVQIALQGNRLVFDVNLARARQSGLNISSKMLNLARSVQQ